MSILVGALFTEHPSNSSISTTTSSVTSMTSLEHESNETSVSASDYGNENWDNENWGEMDVSVVVVGSPRIALVWCCVVIL